MKEQECNICFQTKPISKFEWQKNRPNPRKTCQVCREQARNKKVRKQSREKWLEAKGPDYKRMNYERSVYGVCKEDFTYSQCWICDSVERLCIDHCHSTGVVRGLLCTHCNFALGHFKDDIDRMERAIMYLKTQPHFELG